MLSPFLLCSDAVMDDCIASCIAVVGKITLDPIEPIAIGDHRKHGLHDMTSNHEMAFAKRTLPAKNKGCATAAWDAL